MFQLFGARRVSIRAVLSLVLLTILMATGLLVYMTFRTVNEGEVRQGELAAVANTAVLLEDVRAEYLNEWLVVISARPPLDNSFVARFDRARNRVDWAFAQITEMSGGLDQEQAARIAGWAAGHGALAQSWTEVIALMLEGRVDEARALTTTGLLQQSNLFIDDLTLEVQRNRLALNAELANSEVSRAIWERYALMIGALWLVVLAGAAYAARRWLMNPIEELARATRLIADGQEAALAPISGPTELARLAGDVNMMAVSLISRSDALNQYLSKNLEARSAELEAANEALRSSEGRLNAVIESAPIVLFALDKDGLYTLCKGKALSAFNIKGGALIGRPVQEVFAGQPAILEAMERALSGEEFVAELHLGEVVFETHFGALRDEQGKLAGVMGVCVDVSERQRAEDALRQSEERYKELFENATDIVYTHDLRGNFTSVNKAVVRVTGYSEEECLRMNLGDMMSQDDIDISLEMLRRKREGQERRTTYQVELIARDGRTVPLEVSTRLVYANGEPNGVQGIARDISDRLLAEQALRLHANDLEALNEQLAAAHGDLAASQSQIEEKSRQLESSLVLERARARIDPLTGALNHGAIVEELRAVVAEGADGPPSAIVMLDIDAMKASNDLYGHPFGDQVLKAVKGALTRDEAIVGRYGGDEFVAILRGAGRAAAEAYRRDVFAAVASAGLNDPAAGTEVAIDVSIGFSIFPEEAVRIEELIALADSAMYRYKREQPVRAVEAASRRMGGEQAVRIVGELVPVLISSEDPRERLAYVCQRLAVACGYDGVEIMMNPWMTEGRELVVAYPPIPPEYQEQWLKARMEYYQAHPLPDLLEKTGRPLIIDSPQEDVRMAAFQREILKLAGLNSVMIAPLFWESTLIGSLSVASKTEGAFGPVDAQLLMGIASQVSAVLSMAMLVHDFRDRSARLTAAQGEAVKLLAWVVEAQSGVPSHDFERIRSVAENLARKLGSGQDEAIEIGLAAMLHDVGKYRVPAEVLARPDDLTPAEYEVVKLHTIWGHRLLRGHASFELASQVARWHHERWDGHGYPDGLAGDEIPMGVAIASVSDALDAMVYDRVYRLGMAPDAALEELIAGSGSQFNPRVVQALVELYHEGLLPLALSTNGRNLAAA